jgi:site-specific recombinase XerD
MKSAEETIGRFADAMAARGFAKMTMSRRVLYMLRFARFLAAEGKPDLLRVTPAEIEAWRLHLVQTPSSKGLPRRAGTLNNAMVTVRSFYRLLFEADVISYDPARKHKLVKLPPRLPPPVPSEDDTRRLIESVDPSTPLGARDRAILELFYGTGIRVGELVALEVDDIDLGARLCRIRRGKGGKGRIVPFGPSAAQQLDNYIRWVRPGWLRNRPETALWLNQWGLRLTEWTARKRVRFAAVAAGFERRLTPHGLRHACATHLLENHADLRHIQELLGHGSVKTTQIYTHVSVKHLRETLARCHPRERDPLADGEPDEGSESK